MKKYFDFFLGFIFPKKCLSCQKFWDYICDECFAKIPRRKNKIINTDYIEKIFCNFYYKSFLVQKILRNAKFHWFSDQIKVFWKEIYINLKSNFREKKVILVPVPIHFLRRFFRWSNQTEILAKSILEEFEKDEFKTFELDISNLLKRQKKTKHQYLLSKQERKQNLKNAFSINKKELQKIWENDLLIILDDIFTTWETIENCFFEIKKNLNNEVFAAVICSDR